ncbi:hypothetical protein DIPPA_34525 [Diplonema papillatum]|nr:hypothetical protein DIPPA_34525 [Diplonema papillatum]
MPVFQPGWHLHTGALAPPAQAEAVVHGPLRFFRGLALPEPIILELPAFSSSAASVVRTE